MIDSPPVFPKLPASPLSMTTSSKDIESVRAKVDDRFASLLKTEAREPLPPDSGGTLIEADAKSDDEINELRSLPDFTDSVRSQTGLIVEKRDINRTIVESRNISLDPKLFGVEHVVLQVSTNTQQTGAELERSELLAKPLQTSYQISALISARSTNVEAGPVSALSHQVARREPDRTDASPSLSPLMTNGQVQAGPLSNPDNFSVTKTVLSTSAGGLTGLNTAARPLTPGVILQLSLSPADLGTVDVTISQTTNGVMVHLRAQTVKGHAALLSDSEVLGTLARDVRATLSVHASTSSGSAHATFSPVPQSTPLPSLPTIAQSLAEQPMSQNPLFENPTDRGGQDDHRPAFQQHRSKRAANSSRVEDAMMPATTARKNIVV